MRDMIMEIHLVSSNLHGNKLFIFLDRNESADRSHKPKGPTKGRLPFKGPSRGGFGSKGAFGIRRWIDLFSKYRVD